MQVYSEQIEQLKEKVNLVKAKADIYSSSFISSKFFELHKLLFGVLIYPELTIE